MKYYYVYCESRDSATNPDFKHYVRLYKEEAGKAILVDQGLTNLISDWEKKYDATLSDVNPYPHLD